MWRVIQAVIKGHLNRFSEVQVIVEELEKKHADDYTPEQLRAWAHMINLRKHSSYENPPEKPFFKNIAKLRKKQEVNMSTGKRQSA